MDLEAIKELIKCSEIFWETQATLRDAKPDVKDLISEVERLRAELEARKVKSDAHTMLVEWHTKFGVPIQGSPSFPGKDRADLRVSLINEEAQEFEEASDAMNVLLAADALADLLYVVYGAALEWGIPVDAVLREVHRSNMTKVWSDGTVHYRDDGKVLKPPTYSPADIAKALESHGPFSPLGPVREEDGISVKGEK